MVATTTIRRRQAKHQNLPENHDRTAAIDHAVRVLYRVCCLTGSASLIDKIRADLDADGVRAAMNKHHTAAVFDWLLAALSYQGIADQIAYDYMEQHGHVRWEDINKKLAQGVTCPKLKSYWHFRGCQYTKLRRTCTQPDHIARCPLPTHDLRNGHLNQLAYSLYLFIRDLAEGDLIGWIDRQLQAANSPTGPDPVPRMRSAIIAPLRGIYGVSDKVLTMALSSLLLGAPTKLRLWREVGASMIAIDTLANGWWEAESAGNGTAAAGKKIPSQLPKPKIAASEVAKQDSKGKGKSVGTPAAAAGRKTLSPPNTKIAALEAGRKQDGKGKANSTGASARGKSIVPVLKPKSSSIDGKKQDGRGKAESAGASGIAAGSKQKPSLASKSKTPEIEARKQDAKGKVETVGASSSAIAAAGKQKPSPAPKSKTSETEVKKQSGKGKAEAAGEDGRAAARSSRQAAPTRKSDRS
jgi:hypothetical protein